MNSLPFKITNTSARSGLGSFKQGIPVTKGFFTANELLAVFDEQQQLSDVYVSVEKLWEDGSVKWLFVGGVVHLRANGSATFCVRPVKPDVREEELVVSESSNALSIKTNLETVCRVSLQQPATLTLPQLAHITMHFNGQTIDQAGLKHNEYEYLSNGLSHEAVKTSQSFEVMNTNQKIRIFQEFHIFLSSGTALCTLTVTNPSAAEHPHGKWDLGDPNSIAVSELGLTIQLIKGEATICASELEGTQRPTTVFQASSGGEQWKNSIHVDHSNKVTLPFKGFKALANDTCLLKGSTIQPMLTCKTEARNDLVIEVTDFWQHFPSSLIVEGKTAKYSLLGSALAPKQELQPGEQLTRQFSIGYESILKFDVEITQPLTSSHQFFPLFSAPRDNNPFDSLIRKAVDGNNSFFEKRKRADVYGWRNYGELYADHERGNIPHDESFVSHYNNQYDPISGMLCQWFCSGNIKWKRLADNLAKHVANIDVYHTSLDKPEYSGGLFWHTDHYVQAYTATHRTYSVLQPNDVYQDHAGGGGPGGQHCYTNGLLFHYYLTGSTTSKSALLSICEWIERYYEGDGTLVGTLLAIKNAGNVGLKNVITGAYPLDRGTANYLQALLDRYDLLANSSDLAKCATIIANTVSPDDDINQRNLEDVEQTWFYTVFLQALCRFIFVKEQLAQNDKDYSYAVQSLCHYATWMAENEYVYLEKPDILEFPNDTWTGQDLRKLCILSFARAYLPSNGRIDDKLVELTKGIYQRLSLSTEADTTRVLCLLMQNAHYDVYAELPKPMKRVECNITKHRKSSFSVFMLHAIGRFSLRKERSQLAKRFPQLQKWIGQP
jgi:hypothetical protein